MTFNFLGLKISFSLLFLMLITIIVLLFLAPSYLNTNSSNNQMAKQLLYGAGAVAVVLLLLYICMAYTSYPSDYSIYSQDDKFGTGTYWLMILGIILLAAIVALAFYALSYINDNTGHTARILTIVAGSLAAFCLLVPIIYIFYTIISFNMFVDNTSVQPTICENKLFDRSSWNAENRCLDSRPRKKLDKYTTCRDYNEFMFEY